jgi:hypothetical protein
MTCVIPELFPLDKLDREQALMNRLVNERPTGRDAEPLQQWTTLLNALSQATVLIDSRDRGDVLHSSLCAVLVAGAGIARRLGVSPYEADEWPDGNHTRIGGDGALATGHEPQRLVAELWEAATWVAAFVDNHNAIPTTPDWQASEPITELFARTWCLADSVAAREPLRRLVRGHLSRSGRVAT